MIDEHVIMTLKSKIDDTEVDVCVYEDRDGNSHISLELLSGDCVPDDFREDMSNVLWQCHGMTHALCHEIMNGGILETYLLTKGSKIEYRTYVHDTALNSLGPQHGTSSNSSLESLAGAVNTMVSKGIPLLPQQTLVTYLYKEIEPSSWLCVKTCYQTIHAPSPA